MRRLVPGGLLDSGFAALATFATSLYAVTTLDLAALGYYGIFMTAFLTATSVPDYFFFRPWEVASIKGEVQGRLSYLRRALRGGTIVALLSALIAGGVGAILILRAGSEVVVALSVSTVAAAVLSPLQDFVRRSLHISERSFAAAGVSMIQFVGAAGAVLALNGSAIPRVWIPFLALAIANTASLAVGLFLMRTGLESPLESLSFRQVREFGSWLVVTGSLPAVSGFAVNAVVLALAGPVVLGLAEAARIVGRPVLVVTNGLGLTLQPRSVEAAQRKDHSAAVRVRRLYAAITAGLGLVYTGIVAVDWPLNVMHSLAPNAYEVGGLVAAVCAANVMVGITFPGSYELIGARREASVARIELVGQIGRTISAGAVGWVGAFVIAIGDGVLALIRFLGYRTRLPSIYAEGSGEPLEAVADGAK